MKPVVLLVALFMLVNMSTFPDRLGLCVGFPEGFARRARVQVVALGDDLWKHPETSGEVRQRKTRQPIKGLLSSKLH